MITWYTVLSAVALLAACWISGAFLLALAERLLGDEGAGKQRRSLAGRLLTLVGSVFALATLALIAALPILVLLAIL